ncbi:MAG: hypothetical protein SNJ78_02995 [Spirochaetales bacterium]
MKIITIIGAGYMGTALAWPLRDRGHTVRLVGTHLDEEIIDECKHTGVHPKLNRRLPEGVQVYPISDVDKALEDAEIIVSGVSSSGVHWIADILKDRIQPGQRVIGVTKGLEISEEGEVRIFPEVIREAFPENIQKQVTVAAIGGPCIANELAGRRQTGVVFGAPSYKEAEELARIFRTSYYHIWPTDDLYSLEVSVALKNFFALAVGTAYGRLEKEGGLDDAGASMHNLASALFAEGTLEIYRFLKETGGNPEFAFTLPGVGDLYVTVTGGRSVRMGKLLGSGLSYAEAVLKLPGETLEAVEIIRAMSRWIDAGDRKGTRKPNDYPLMRALIDVVVWGKPLEWNLEAWFSSTY